jgi:1-acyl-sn-glycerol-3-phosphate acyltransferase
MLEGNDRVAGDPEGRTATPNNEMQKKGKKNTKAQKQVNGRYHGDFGSPANGVWVFGFFSVLPLIIRLTSFHSGVVSLLLLPLLLTRFGRPTSSI